MEWKKQLPNAVSASRIPCAFAVLECARRGKWQAAFGWFLVGAATDNLDGKLARWLNAVSRLGSELLEPVGDTALVKLAEVGLITQGEFTWENFWLVNGFGGALLAPVLLLPGNHPVSLRCDTAIGFVYVGELAYCTWKYARLAEANNFLRWGPWSLPIVVWLCRKTISRWLRQLA